MSADILRRAAALMRERATPPTPPGPWESEFSDVIRTDVPFGNAGYLITECATVAEARHIASWHPAVAFAVADWLDNSARHAQSREDNGSASDKSADPRALRVARAYLGESA